MFSKTILDRAAHSQRNWIIDSIPNWNLHEHTHNRQNFFEIYFPYQDKNIGEEKIFLWAQSGSKIGHRTFNGFRCCAKRSALKNNFQLIYSLNIIKFPVNISAAKTH